MEVLTVVVGMVWQWVMNQRGATEVLAEVVMRMCRGREGRVLVVTTSVVLLVVLVMEEGTAIVVVVVVMVML